jgi:hypothetical protein
MPAKYVFILSCWRLLSIRVINLVHSLLLTGPVSVSNPVFELESLQAEVLAAEEAVVVAKAA